MANLIKVAKEAVEEFNKIKQNTKYSENVMLRISFGGTGWGGPRFGLTLDELKNDDDVVEESEGIKVVYKSEFKGWLKGALIYYSNSWFSKGFAIDIRGAC